jgi:predicted small secreted protein
VPKESDDGAVRRVLIGLVLVASVALASCSTSNPFASGHGTAVITWNAAIGILNLNQPLSGSIEGLPVSGVATSALGTAP